MGALLWYELKFLLSRLKMEHLSYHVESLLEQAAKKEAELPGVPVHGATAEMEQQGISAVWSPGWKQARLPWVKTLEQFDFTFRASTVRLSGNWLVWRSWSAAKT